MRFARKYTHYILAMLMVLAGLWGNTTRAMAKDLAQDAPPVIIYLFWGDGCPHCAEAKPFLQELAQRYPNVQVESFEVWYNADNQTLFQQMTAARDFEPRYVPTIFIGERQWEGFSDGLRQEIEAAVQACVETGCSDAGAGIIPGHEIQPAPTPADSCTTSTCSEELITPELVSSALNIYLFLGEGCPHCDVTHLEGLASHYAALSAADNDEIKSFLQALAQQHPQLQLQVYEVWYAPQNQKLFDKMAAAFGFTPHGVPTIFIGERYWKGFSETIKTEIEAYVRTCLASGCLDRGAVMAETDAPTADARVAESAPPAVATTLITVPLLGEVNLGAQSLWVSTVLIGVVDGFNPCSLWVLSILIALTLRTGSRKKIFIIGLTFITVTALVYVLFIAGLFTMLTFIRFLGWIQAAVSLLALFFAVINIKDYFWYKEGLSFTIDDAQKPGLYQRMRRVMQAGDSLSALLLATVGLGVGVSLVEFSCTAGFPVLWTNLVAAQNVTPLTFALLLLLYMVIYQIDELGIFLAAVVTLRVSKLEEKHGRILKLIGGMLMLTLAAVMLIRPALMNNLGSSLLIFGAAFGAALLVLLVHRVILPCFGIRIGTETLD